MLNELVKIPFINFCKFDSKKYYNKNVVAHKIAPSDSVLQWSFLLLPMETYY